MITIRQTKKEENFFDTPKAAVLLSCILVITIVFLLIINGMKEPVTYRWEEYTVEEGDTLWTVARDEAVLLSGEDLGSMCSIIARKNGIKDSVIYAGQTILIPVGKDQNDRR